MEVQQKEKTLDRNIVLFFQRINVSHLEILILTDHQKTGILAFE